MLPTLVIGSSVLSLVVALVAVRAMAALGPGALVRAGFAGSALFFVAEWGLSRLAPRTAALVVYFHVAVFGALLISGFWSLVSERFDPRTARRHIGRIAGGGALGGLLGGVLAERVGSGLGVTTMLPVLAALHLACAGLVRPLQDPARVAAAAARRDTPGLRAGFQLLGSMPYLRNLAVVLLLTTTSIVPIDYVFKARADGALAGGAALIRFFAVFYTATGLLAFLVQAGVARRALETLGLARSVGSLPLAVAAGGIGAWLVPGLASATAARGLESTLRHSLFRSGYELLYTPIPAAEKRATKTLIDVGSERLGDALGGGLVSALLLLGSPRAGSLLLLVGAGLALAAFLFASRLQRGYVAALEKSLLERAVQLDLDTVEDPVTRSAVVMTMQALDVRALRAAAGLPELGRRGSAPPEPVRPGSEREFAAGVAASEPVAQEIADLRSGDAARVRAVLEREAQPGRELVPHIIPLLAWDEVAEAALRVLRRVAPAATGQMLDVMLDPGEPFAVRRRLPRALSAAPSQRTADGLMQGLDDRRFEVRVQCARALQRLRAADPGLQIDRDAILAVVLREAQVSKQVWQSQRLLDRADDGEESPFVDALLRDRSSRSLEHVFTLLSLILPVEPLGIAYRGLHSPDEALRGTALEYLESVLPPAVRDSLWPFLEDRRSRAEPRTPSADALAALMRSSESIQISLAELRRLQARNPPEP